MQPSKTKVFNDGLPTSRPHWLTPSKSNWRTDAGAGMHYAIRLEGCGLRRFVFTTLWMYSVCSWYHHRQLVRKCLGHGGEVWWRNFWAAHERFGEEMFRPWRRGLSRKCLSRGWEVWWTKKFGSWMRGLVRKCWAVEELIGLWRRGLLRKCYDGWGEVWWGHFRVVKERFSEKRLGP